MDVLVNGDSQSSDSVIAEDKEAPGTDVRNVISFGDNLTL